MRFLVFVLAFGLTIANAGSDLPKEVFIDEPALVSLLSTYEDNKNPFFIAFYEEGDIQGMTKTFLISVYSGCEANPESGIKFFVYTRRIPQSIKDRYFLHTYTLPKLKYFGTEGVETYAGGTHLKAIDAWIKRKYRDEL